MNHLPISYYRVGQLIQVEGDKGTIRNATVIAVFGTPVDMRRNEPNSVRFEIKGAIGAEPVEKIKPVLRPLANIRINHIIELARRTGAASDKMSDEEILAIVDRESKNDPDYFQIWADSLEVGLWLIDIGYDVTGLIEKGLAVIDEE